MAVSRDGNMADPECFQVFDRDGTGTISKDELRKVMKSIGESLTEAEIDEMLHFADTDGSGTIDCKYGRDLARVGD